MRSNCMPTRKICGMILYASSNVILHGYVYLTYVQHIEKSLNTYGGGGNISYENYSHLSSFKIMLVTRIVQNVISFTRQKCCIL